MDNDKMKAAVLYAPGDLRIEYRDIPVIANDDEVLIAVQAAGICGSDLDRVFKTGMYQMPAVPGHEFCGIVKKVGNGVTDFKTGDRVAVAPILPCFECDSCAQGNYGQCSAYDYIGSRRDGAFAEYVIAPAQNLVRMPDCIDFISGAVVEPACVALHGMLKTQIKVGDTVAVMGCGAIGLLAIQFAKIMGATKILAADILEGKVAAAQKAGASEVFDSSKMDITAKIIELTHGGADVVVETAGVPIVQEQCVRMVKKQGMVLFLGTAHQDVVFPKETFEGIIRNEITMKGTWNSFSAPFPGIEWRAVMELLENEKLDVSSFITNSVSLGDLPDTLLHMKNREIEYNKIVVKIPE